VHIIVNIIIYFAIFFSQEKGFYLKNYNLDPDDECYDLSDTYDDFTDNGNDYINDHGHFEYNDDECINGIFKEDTIRYNKVHIIIVTFWRLKVPNINLEDIFQQKVEKCPICRYYYEIKYINFQLSLISL
jgi:hypothetical protein